MKSEEAIKKYLAKLEAEVGEISPYNPNIKVQVENEIALLKWVLGIKH